ncbi:unnamed protein product [Sphagnum jensenii]
MSEQTPDLQPQGNLLKFPGQFLSPLESFVEDAAEISLTPQADKIIIQAEKLDQLSAYPCTLDYEVYRNLEKRYSEKPIRGGISLKTAFRLVNSHSTCQQCLYAFEVDTYAEVALTIAFTVTLKQNSRFMVTGIIQLADFVERSQAIS